MLGNYFINCVVDYWNICQLMLILQLCIMFMFKRLLSAYDNLY